MIGTGRAQDQPEEHLDSTAKFGNGVVYKLVAARPWAYLGSMAHERVSTASNKASEHNELNMPLTPAMVVRIDPRQLKPRQTNRLLSLPIKIPGLTS